MQDAVSAKEQKKTSEQDDGAHSQLTLDKAVFEAKQAAISFAREQINLYFIFIGILVTLSAGALTVFIEIRIADRVEQTIGEQVRAELGTAVLIPLLVTETSAILNRQDGYSSEDGERILSILERIKPDIIRLNDEARELAFNRIEDTIDMFLNATDYSRVFEVHKIFGDELFTDQGIYMSLTIAASSRLVIHPDFSQEAPTIVRTIYGNNWDPTSIAYEMQRLYRILDRQSAAGFGEESLAGAIQNELQREPVFADVIRNFTIGMEQEVSPRGRHHSELSSARYQTLYNAVEAAIGF